ncbi:MAG: hypothetical protein HRT66_13570 [Flavobacteriaceae bacterium]|nr:hypothetical protein [Flavobacteriaceae bacterium]
MNKIIFIIILSLGVSKISFSQQKEFDTIKYVPNEFVKTLLKENDSLKIVFNKTKDKLTKEQIEKIFSKTKNKEYNLIETRHALEMTSVVGDGFLGFVENLKVERALTFKNHEEFEKFFNSTARSEGLYLERDGSLRRKETTYNDGSKEIIKKDNNGNYIKIIIDKNGIKTIKDISKLKIEKIITDYTIYSIRCDDKTTLDTIVD